MAKYIVTVEVEVEDAERLKLWARAAWDSYALGYKRTPNLTDKQREARAVREWVNAGLWKEEWADEPSEAGVDVRVTGVHVDAL